MTGPATSYPAAYAGLSGGATTAPCSGSCAAPQVVTAPAGGGVAFTVDAAQDGYYDLALQAAGSFTLTADGTSLGSVPATAAVYLHAGINPVEYVAQTGASIGSLSVTPTPRPVRRTPPRTGPRPRRTCWPAPRTTTPTSSTGRSP